MNFVDNQWRDALPVLSEYIAIPARSPMFDVDWEANGHLKRAAQLLADWSRAHAPAGSVVELVEKPGLTPFLIVEVPPTRPELANRTVVVYGHMDKQPEFLPWSSGLGPWDPVVRGDRLYGRGGADDGYATFAALIAIAAVRESGGDHARCLVLIEASEESSSVHLEEHLATLAPRLGEVELVITLDSFCETYDRLWTTTSTRGMCGGVLEIEVCADDPHSGRASGILPSAARILRILLDRIEVAATGQVLLGSASVTVPVNRVDEARRAAEGFPRLASAFRPVASLKPMGEDGFEDLLRGTWLPALEVIGVDGLPPIENAGNVFRSRLSAKLSLRLPPTADPLSVHAEMRAVLEADPPYGAVVRFHPGASGPGWESPAFAPWLEEATNDASLRHWGNPAASCGVGGSIPFMGLLGAQLPSAQFLLIGVLGPGSNAHGPDEFLDIPTTKRVTSTVADVLMAHAGTSR